MKAVRVQEYGPPEVLRVEEAVAPRPAAGVVVVAVEVAGVTYGDTIARSGRYPFPLPYVPGLEVGGTVVETGADVDRSLLGQQVVATTVNNTGGYAQLALAHTANVYAVPAGLPLDRAVAVFQAGAVAIGVLTAMRLRPGETVLITAAAGRIGSLLVQLAKAAGVTVIGAAGGTGKLAAASRFGADVTVDYSKPGWVDQVKSATGGVDVVLDAAGGTTGEHALQAAVTGSGRIGVYGYTSGAWATIDTRQLVRHGLTVTGALGVALAKPQAEQRADAEQALQAARAGRLVPHIHATYPLAHAARAHADLEQRRTTGTVLLRP
jgi:NADPH2:quinone reductase